MVRRKYYRPMVRPLPAGISKPARILRAILSGVSLIPWALFYYLWGW